MVIRNALDKRELVESVIRAAFKISNEFYIVNHWSTDSTSSFIEELFFLDTRVRLELVNESFVWTMDDMKAKHYRLLSERSSVSEDWKYIFILDWDELISDGLATEICALDSKQDAYLINRRTFLISEIIDRNNYLPLIFKPTAVEINTFHKVHGLYKIHTKKIQKLKGILYHYSYANIDDLLKKTIYYGKIEAQELFEKNPNLSSFSLFFRWIYEGILYSSYLLFFHWNFLHLEWWFYSIWYFCFKLFKYLYYIELKNEYKKSVIQDRK